MKKIKGLGPGDILLRLVVGYVIGSVIVILFALNADAHHAIISGQSSCSVNGTSTVTVTAEAWPQTEVEQHFPGGDISYRVNRDVRINTVVNGETTEIGRGEFVPGNGYKFTATFVAPTSLGSVYVNAVPVAPWGFNGEHGTYPYVAETVIALQPECVTTTVSAPTTSTTVPVATTTTTVVAPMDPPSNVAEPIITLPRFTG